MFRTRMSAIEMSQSSSSAVGIPNIKDIKFTRFELSIMSVEKYREERKNNMLHFERIMPIKYANSDEIKTADLLVKTQIERFEIIRKEDAARKKIEERMEKEIDRDITPIEALGKLPDIEVLDSEYMMLQNQYNFQIQKLRIDQDQFMSELLQCIEFHEKALNLYKSETTEMYVQTAAEITKQHYKEIEMKQKELSEFEKQRQEFEKKEQSE